MASLKALKGRIASVKSTQKITKAMKMVAAAKLRRAQQAAEAGAPLCRADGGGDRQPRRPRSRSARRARSCSPAPARTRPICSSSAPRTAASPARSTRTSSAPRASKADELIGRGQDGLFLPGRPQGPGGDPAPLPEADRPPARHQRDQAGQLRRRPGDRRRHDRPLQTDGIDVVHLFYARFRSALVQEPVGQQIIPVPPVEAGEADAAAALLAAIEYEPDEEEILAELLPRNVAVQIFRALLENAASEQGSRMTAMDNATRNAGDMINRLTIQYNRTRQAAITTELIEIISGAEAL
jgi:F-type H+-transporting ATPase subunit gamma